MTADACQNCVHRRLCDHAKRDGLCDSYDSEQFPRATIMLAWVMTLTGLTMLALMIWMNL